jgi:hypothetical protein
MEKQAVLPFLVGGAAAGLTAFEVLSALNSLRQGRLGRAAMHGAFALPMIGWTGRGLKLIGHGLGGGKRLASGATAGQRLARSAETAKSLPKGVRPTTLQRVATSKNILTGGPQSRMALSTEAGRWGPAAAGLGQKFIGAGKRLRQSPTEKYLRKHPAIRGGIFAGPLAYSLAAPHPTATSARTQLAQTGARGAARGVQSVGQYDPFYRGLNRPIL